MARFLLDANMPRGALDSLRELGHDVLDVRDLGIVSPDEAVFEYAQAEQRAVITRDLGFGERALTRTSHHGVVLLRVENLRSAAIIECMLDGMKALPDLANTVFVIEPGRTRARRSES